MEILSSVGQYPYVFLFFGMFFFGEMVLLLALYISTLGQLNPWVVFVVSLSATLILDLVWYEVAARMPFDIIKKWKGVERHQATFERLSHAFGKCHLWILFISKFVYGTRILVQILCGAKKVNFWKYFMVNIAGIVAYMGLLFAIAFAVNKTLGERLIGEMRFAVPIFIVIALLINLCIKNMLQRNMLR